VAVMGLKNSEEDRYSSARVRNGLYIDRQTGKVMSVKRFLYGKERFSDKIMGEASSSKVASFNQILTNAIIEQRKELGTYRGEVAEQDPIPDMEQLGALFDSTAEGIKQAEKESTGHGLKNVNRFERHMTEEGYLQETITTGRGVIKVARLENGGPTLGFEANFRRSTTGNQIEVRASKLTGEAVTRIQKPNGERLYSEDPEVVVIALNGAFEDAQNASRATVETLAQKQAA